MSTSEPNIKSKISCCLTKEIHVKVRNLITINAVLEDAGLLSAKCLAIMT